MVENNDTSRYTIVGTDIEDVKRRNSQSGMSYNEVKAFLARTTGGHGTNMYSNTNAKKVREKNKPKSQLT